MFYQLGTDRSGRTDRSTATILVEPSVLLVEPTVLRPMRTIDIRRGFVLDDRISSKTVMLVNEENGHPGPASQPASRQVGV